MKIPPPGSPDTKVVNCTLCNSSNIQILYPLKEFSVVRCQNCGLVFLDIELNREKISEMYSDTYYNERSDYFHVARSTGEFGEAKGGDLRNFQNGLGLLDKYHPGKGKLLDVGCALGGFLRLARHAGWMAHGVDISNYAAAYCRERLGLEAQSGMLGELGFADGIFDVVTLWDVLEHFENPLEQLREVNRILKTGGVMLVDTPNERSLIRSIARLIYSVTGGRIDYPMRKLFHRFHLYYFNQATLNKLLVDSGFELIHLEGRPLPSDKGRTDFFGRLAVDAFSLPEKLFRREFELVALARKVN